MLYWAPWAGDRGSTRGPSARSSRRDDRDTRDARARNLSLQPFPRASTCRRTDSPRLSYDAARTGFSFGGGARSRARRHPVHAASVAVLSGVRGTIHRHTAPFWLTADISRLTALRWAQAATSRSVKSTQCAKAYRRHPAPLNTTPGFAPVTRPSSTTATPFTNT